VITTTNTCMASYSAIGATKMSAAKIEVHEHANRFGLAMLLPDRFRTAVHGGRANGWDVIGFVVLVRAD